MGIFSLRQGQLVPLLGLSCESLHHALDGMMQTPPPAPTQEMNLPSPLGDGGGTRWCLSSFHGSQCCLMFTWSCCQETSTHSFNLIPFSSVQSLSRI